MVDQFVNGMEGKDESGKLLPEAGGYHKTITTIKHYAANNSEVNRRTGSSDMDDRTLREYYTEGRSAASSQDSQPGSVMSLLQPVNGDADRGRPVPDRHADAPDVRLRGLLHVGLRRDVRDRPPATTGSRRGLDAPGQQHRAQRARASRRRGLSTATPATTTTTTTSTQLPAATDAADQDADWTRYNVNDLDTAARAPVHRAHEDRRVRRSDAACRGSRKARARRAAGQLGQQRRQQRRDRDAGRGWRSPARRPTRRSSCSRTRRQAAASARYGARSSP